MQNSIYPHDIINNTSEQILAPDAAKGHIIYSLFILSIIIMLILLPILKVTISIQSNGIIRPVIEKNEIKSLATGIINEVFVKENQTIKKNQPLLILDNSVLNKELQLINYQEKEEKNSIYDLELLLNSDLSNLSEQLIKTSDFKNLHYKNEYLYFKNQLKENFYNQTKAKKELNRYKTLNKDKLASLSELEQKDLELSKLQFQYKMLIENQNAKWNKELLAGRLKLNELKTKKKQTEKEKEFSVIKSPVSGTIEQFSGITAGGYIQAGQLIAVISPSSDIIAEVYMSPQDIGLINIGTKANIQVDAFNYNQWGLIKGEVIKISDDFYPIDNQPFFRVKCKLNKNYLQLKNGYKRYLKKGMTIRTRFLIAKRSLFQLLYDKVDDWINPLQKSE
ncbi:MAG: HlyD family efflux transporter periplasmic adaptor subunit [Deltaproteobacteria bacterium]|nr:HlyD family efflux transporter periplasmic adaptor subunit [Deltaproteobacteria bacterium]